MSKKIRRLIVLAIISASMAFATGCGAGSAGKDTGKEAASTVENGGNADSACEKGRKCTYK